MAYQTLHERLRGPITAAVQKDLSIKNVNAAPKVEKVTVNVGINKSKMDSKEKRAYIEQMLMLITGQKPVFTKARIAISNFKTREGMVVGAKVTLRGKNMEEFLDRFISYSIPRIRDFRGLPTKLDGKGNYSIGLQDHSIFPEVPAPDAGQIFSMQVVITTTATDDKEGMALMKNMGMPFKRNEAADAAKAKAEKEAKIASGAKAPEKEEVKKEEENVASEAQTTDTTETSESETLNT